MEDMSELDQRYFVDEDTFNCPFCRRRNIPYFVKSRGTFNWTREKSCFYFTAKCSYCDRRTFHLTFEEDLISTYFSSTRYKVQLEEGVLMDSLIIYSRPTSFFTLDSAINETVRTHISEAEQALQFNLLTGSSASLRKAIYTLLKNEKCIVINEKTNRTDYSASLRELKAKFSSVDATLFDALSHVQGLTSDNVHEDAWESWDTTNLKFLIELSKSMLTEMYVVPNVRATRLKQLEELRKEAQKKIVKTASGKNSNTPN